MKEYLKVTRQIMAKFSTTSVTQVARGKNRHADSLATLASAMTEDIPQQIKVELISEPSIRAAANCATKVDVDNSWVVLDGPNYQTSRRG